MESHERWDLGVKTTAAGAGMFAAGASGATNATTIAANTFLTQGLVSGMATGMMTGGFGLVIIGVGIIGFGVYKLIEE